ncbi:MAG: hypothetical protein DMG73_18415 [Acidobacteria bacterium]|nr:MAG: hypothetical protein DMG73_18415 [Acidobacteriota bacterium]
MPEGFLFCSKCGAQNSTAAQFCSRCGAPFGVIPQAVTGTPLAAPQAFYATTTPVPATAGYGGFWIRLVAAILDGILVQVVVVPVSIMVGAVIGAAGFAVSMSSMGVRLVSMIVGATLGFLASWLYEAVLESSPRQATLGKMVLGLKVTDLAGNRISFARACGRHFAKYLSGAIFFIGYIIAGFTDRKQALHDMIAGTLVRRT